VSEGFPSGSTSTLAFVAVSGSYGGVRRPSPEPAKCYSRSPTCATPVTSWRAATIDTDNQGSLLALRLSSVRWSPIWHARAYPVPSFRLYTARSFVQTPGFTLSGPILGGSRIIGRNRPFSVTWAVRGEDCLQLSVARR